MFSLSFSLDRWSVLKRLKGKVLGRPAREDTISLVAHQHSLVPSLASALNRRLLLAGCTRQAPAAAPGTFANVATEWSVHPVYLCELHRGLIHLSTGTIHDRESGKYLLETSWGWGKYETAAPRRFNHREIYVRSTKPVYPVTSVGYHGIMEDISALLLLRKLGFEFDVAIDERNQWMIRLLAALLPPGIQVMPLQGGTWIRAEQLLITTKSAFGEFTHPELLGVLREAATRLPGGSSLPRRIFVSRADTANRAYPYERELEASFQRKGFTPVRLAALPAADQVRAFREATHVAGLHGGGLANLVWGRDSIDVFELYSLAHYNSCYSSLCFTLGHAYRNQALRENFVPGDF